MDDKYDFVNDVEECLERKEIDADVLLEKERVSNVYKEFQTSLYYTNRYMIEYMRNAISHGKVYYRFNES